MNGFNVLHTNQEYNKLIFFGSREELEAKSDREIMEIYSYAEWVLECYKTRLNNLYKNEKSERWYVYETESGIVDTISGKKREYQTFPVLLTQCEYKRLSGAELRNGRCEMCLNWYANKIHHLQNYLKMIVALTAQKISEYQK